MQNNLKLSIVTPSFNQGKFIKRTLESVLSRQNYGNIEHIVVDGLSSDETLEILKEHKEKYPDKFHYRYEKDTGQADATNKGFKMANGDIIGWLNSDDYYEDNVFQFVADYFSDHPDVDMIYGGCNRINGKGEFLRMFEEEYGFKKYNIENYQDFNYDTLLNVYSGIIPQPAAFFRKSVFEKVGYIDENYHFGLDYEFWLRIGKKGKIQRAHRVLGNFRIHEEAKTVFKNRFTLFKEYLKARKKHGGRLIAPFYLLIWTVSIKTIIKMLLIKLRILKA